MPRVRSLFKHPNSHLNHFQSKPNIHTSSPLINMPSNPVPLVELGKNGPKVPHLGFGLMGLSYETYGTVPNDEERFKILDRAHELGSTFWDSAEYVLSSCLPHLPLIYTN